MQFNEKLTFLMNITQTTNKELAKGISVDPSLISLLRSGKRRQPQNPHHIQNMAAFFARKSSAQFQRSALSEMLGQRSINATMPTEVLSERLAKWLTKDPDFIDDLVAGMETAPDMLPDSEEVVPAVNLQHDAGFYFGEEGRREVMKRMTQMIRQSNMTGSLLISSDDNLEWLLSDYALTRQIQSQILEIVRNGITIYQIMPAIIFLPRYAESLQFWLPIYSTGSVKVYYYPRLRDNLYRRSTIIYPGHCIRSSSAIGLGSSSDITMFSTDPQVIEAYIRQFQDHLSLCRPALSVHTKPEEFSGLFADISSRQGLHISMAAPLSPHTLPPDLLTDIINHTTDCECRAEYQRVLRQIPQFEESLKEYTYIDMDYLATPQEILSGKVYIMFPNKLYPEPPFYTPETYILHLKNILRLMDEYDNYYFVPCDDSRKLHFNLLTNSDGLALLLRTNHSPLMVEMKRPELVMACQEYLLRKAEQLGYDGMQKEKNRRLIQNRIKELQRTLH